MLQKTEEYLGIISKTKNPNTLEEDHCLLIKLFVKIRNILNLQALNEYYDIFQSL